MDKEIFQFVVDYGGASLDKCINEKAMEYYVNSLVNRKKIDASKICVYKMSGENYIRWRPHFLDLLCKK